MRPASPDKARNGSDTGLRLLLWPLLAAIVFGLIGFGELLEDGLRIGRNAIRSHSASSDIVLVEIDDASLREVGSWPWPRSKQARLIEDIDSLGARQILLDIHAERSSVQPAAVDIGFTFQTQEADNQLLVDDGQTAVVGGLTVTEVTVQKTGIPFLVDLPVIGKLFGFSSQQEFRRDLLILITPHIVDDLVAPAQGR